MHTTTRRPQVLDPFGTMVFLACHKYYTKARIHIGTTSLTRQEDSRWTTIQRTIRSVAKNQDRGQEIVYLARPIHTFTFWFTQSDNPRMREIASKISALAIEGLQSLQQTYDHKSDVQEDIDKLIQAIEKKQALVHFISPNEWLKDLWPLDKIEKTYTRLLIAEQQWTERIKPTDTIDAINRTLREFEDKIKTLLSDPSSVPSQWDTSGLMDTSFSLRSSSGSLDRTGSFTNLKQEEATSSPTQQSFSLQTSQERPPAECSKSELPHQEEKPLQPKVALSDEYDQRSVEIEAHQTEQNAVHPLLEVHSDKQTVGNSAHTTIQKQSDPISESVAPLSDGDSKKLPEPPTKGARRKK